MQGPFSDARARGVGRRPLSGRALPPLSLLALLLLGAPPAARARAPRLAVTSEDGQSSVEVKFTAQLRFEWENTDGGSSKPRDDTTALFLRRIRPEIVGTLVTTDLRYRVHLSTAPNSLEVMDVYLDYAFHPQVSLLFGQNKIPFTRYRMNSFKDLPMVEWSHETRYFGAERQFGFVLHNGMDKPGPFEYEFALLTGTNARASNAVGLPKLYLESVDNPSDLSAPAPRADVHPELVLHLAYNSPGMELRRATDFDGGPSRISAGLSFAWDTRPDGVQDLAVRVAPEVIYKVEHFSLTAVGYLGLWEPTHGSDRPALGLAGGLAMLSYLFAERYEVAARYVVLAFLDRLRDDLRAWADDHIAAAADVDEEEELRGQYGKLGRLEVEHEAGLGFNVYLFERVVQLQLDGALLVHQRSDGDRMDVRVRSEVQIAF